MSIKSKGQEIIQTEHFYGLQCGFPRNYNTRSFEFTQMMFSFRYTVEDSLFDKLDFRKNSYENV